MLSEPFSEVTMSKSVYLPLTRKQYFDAVLAHNLRVSVETEPPHTERSLQALVGRHRIALFARIPRTYLDGVHDIVVSYKVKDLPTDRFRADYSLLRSAWVTCLATGKELPADALDKAQRELRRNCEPVDQAYLVPVLSLLQGGDTFVRAFDDLAVIQEALEQIHLPKHREKMQGMYYQYLPVERAERHAAHPKDKHMTLHFEEKNRLLPPP